MNQSLLLTNLKMVELRRWIRCPMGWRRKWAANGALRGRHL